MFSGNVKIENAIKIINAVEDGKFVLLLNRIAQFLSNDSSSKPFTEVEEIKLEASLELTKSEVHMLVDGLVEMFQICAYYLIKPGALNDELLQNLFLNARKTEIFVQVWSSSAKGIIDGLKRKIYFPQLDHLSYSVSVETGSDSLSKEKLAKAQLQLGLASLNGKEDLNLEFNHDELYKLYKMLEQVQEQLDALR